MFDKFKASRLLIASVAIATILTGCTKELVPENVVAMPTVKIINVGAQTQTSIRQFPAEVEANKDTHLAFRVSGELTKFSVKAGNHVKKGQLLAQLDPTDFKIQLNDRQARFALAKAQYERAQQLLEKQLTSQAEFDQAKANMLVSQSTLESSKVALNYTTLYAPYDGIIAKVFAENLQNVQAQQVVLDMQSLDTIDITIQVPEALIATINKDANYEPVVVFDFSPDVQHSIIIKEWDAQADLLTRTYKIVFSMPMPQNTNILPGMTGTVIVDLNKGLTDKASTKQTFRLPMAAVFSAEDLPLTDNNRYVWQVLDDMLVKRLEVVVGEINSQGIEILSGLNGDEKIVGAGVHFIQPGMTVRAWVRERGL